jgi:ComF family protein
MILDILYPRRCPICDDVLLPGQLICADCGGRVKLLCEPACKKCGKPLSDERKEFCADCERKKHQFRQGKAVFSYEGGIRSSMYRFKYGNKREYAVFYAAEAQKLYACWVREKGIEVIVPVPMYAKKKRRRGYNQAEVFARQLGKRMHIPVNRKLVKRIRNTTPQKELNEAERKSNLKNAFQLMPDIVKYNHILVVDDIYTTGSTIDEVAKVLLDAGAKDIYYLCISIGKGY